MPAASSHSATIIRDVAARSLPTLGLIRSRGHLHRGGYDAQNGAKQDRAKRARRQFTDEFKAGAVRLVPDEGKTVAQVARDLDLTPSALGGCVKRAQADRDGGKSGLTAEERGELARLRKEVRALRIERDIRDVSTARGTSCLGSILPITSSDGVG